MNIAESFLHNVDGGDLTFVRSGKSELVATRSQLRETVAIIGLRLQLRGVRSGDSILIVMESRLEAIAFVLAAFNLGIQAVPLPPLVGVRNMQWIVRSIKPTCCVFDDIPPQEVSALLVECAHTCIALRTGSGSESAGWLNYRQFSDGVPPPLLFPAYEKSQPALVIHSSGSKGVPKAIGMTQGELRTFFDRQVQIWSQYDIEANDGAARGAVVCALPTSHLAGLGVCLHGLLTTRPIFLMASFSPSVCVSVMERAHCNNIVMMPSFYRSLLREPGLRERDWAALRFCITGGEGCSEELMREIEAAFGARVVTAYSMTECLSGIAHSRNDLLSGRSKYGSCGKVMFGAVKLVDYEGREHASLGELWVQNDTVHPAYSDEETNSKRMADGWFRTGDVFYRDTDGEFFHKGRADDMFICRGKNIYPAEIENALLRHPAVAVACTAPILQNSGDVAPAMLVVMKHPITESELVAFAIESCPSHAIPAFVQFVDKVPEIGPGKIDRRAVAKMLQEMYVAGQSAKSPSRREALCRQ